jgi:hypothetical protein
MVVQDIHAQLIILKRDLERRLLEAREQIESLLGVQQVIQQDLAAVDRLLHSPLHQGADARAAEVAPSDDCQHADLKGMTVPDACEVVLKEHGGPMKVAELVRSLIDRRLQIQSETPWRTINTALLRNGRRFVKVAPGTYALAPKPSESAEQQTSQRLNERGAVVWSSDILKQAGHPMHVRDILAELLRQGFRSNAERPEAMLSGTLKQSKRFRLLGGDHWALAEWEQDQS